MSDITSALKSILYTAFPANFRLYVNQKFVNEHDHLKYLNTSYSQEGEDIILSHLFHGKSNGFYLDVGAHHPVQYSNTYKFYLMGWCGINVDAMPGSMVAFNESRPRDINVEAAIASNSQHLTYYMFSSAGTNTLSEAHAHEMQRQGGQLLREVPIQTVPFADLLRKHLKTGQPIDFMSLDVEGLELDVLMSNDWTTYRPAVLLVESLHLNNKAELQQYMHQHSYQLIAHTVHNLYFRDTTITKLV